MMNCNHIWVERLDGYEEQCGPAICCVCGLYGCYCSALWTKMNDKEREEFKRNGINGNDRELEKLKNKEICGIKDRFEILDL